MTLYNNVSVLWSITIAPMVFCRFVRKCLVVHTVIFPSSSVLFFLCPAFPFFPCMPRWWLAVLCAARLPPSFGPSVCRFFVWKFLFSQPSVLQCVACLVCVFSSCGVEKSFKKIWRYGKKQYLCNPVWEMGVPVGALVLWKVGLCDAPARVFREFPRPSGLRKIFWKKFWRIKKKGLPLQPRFKIERNSKFIEKTEKYKYKQVPRIQ